MEIYIQGVWPRKVKKIPQKLCEVNVSKRQASELARKLEARIKFWRKRPISRYIRI
jgi:transposase-like protein